MSTKEYDNIRIIVLIGLIAFLLIFILFSIIIYRTNILNLLIPIILIIIFSALFFWRLLIFNIQPNKQKITTITGNSIIISDIINLKNAFLDTSKASNAISYLLSSNIDDHHFIIFTISDNDEQYVQFSKAINGILLNWPYINEKSSHNKQQLQLVSNVLSTNNYKQIQIHDKHIPNIEINEYIIFHDGIYANIGIEQDIIMNVIIQLFRNIYKYNIVSSKTDNSLSVNIVIDR